MIRVKGLRLRIDLPHPHNHKNGVPLYAVSSIYYVGGKDHNHGEGIISSTKRIASYCRALCAPPMRRHLVVWPGSYSSFHATKPLNPQPLPLRAELPLNALTAATSLAYGSTQALALVCQ